MSSRTLKLPPAYQMTKAQRLVNNAKYAIHKTEEAKIEMKPKLATALTSAPSARWDQLPVLTRIFNGDSDSVDLDEQEKSESLCSHDLSLFKGHNNAHYSMVEAVRSRNPIYALESIKDSVINNIPLCKMIGDWLVYAIDENIISEGKITLDSVLGFKLTRGKTTPFERYDDFPEIRRDLIVEKLSCRLVKKDPTQACRDVAKHINKNWKTIMNHYESRKSEIDEIVKIKIKECASDELAGTEWREEGFYQEIDYPLAELERCRLPQVIHGPAVRQTLASIRNTAATHPQILYDFAIRKCRDSDVEATRIVAKHYEVSIDTVQFLRVQYKGYIDKQINILNNILKSGNQADKKILKELYTELDIPYREIIAKYRPKRIASVKVETAAPRMHRGKYTDQFKIIVFKYESLHSLKEACYKFKVSRQAISNWRHWYYSLTADKLREIEEGSQESATAMSSEEWDKNKMQPRSPKKK